MSILNDPNFCIDPAMPSWVEDKWKEFFLHVHAKENATDYLFDTDLFPLQHRRELEKMIDVASSISPKTIMEIGCDKCSGLYQFCLIPSVRRVIGCEIRCTPFAPLFQDNFPNIKFHWLRNSRYPAYVEGVKSFLEETKGYYLEIGNKIDVLFIDGDKCFYTEDFDTYLPMMNPNGIVFMHDITHGYPKEVFEKMSKDRGYTTEIIRDVSEYRALESGKSKIRTGYDQWLMHWKDTSCGVGVVYLNK